jgi:FHS family glucose/mannose:H+ symporter-like MFS transporter
MRPDQQRSPSVAAGLGYASFLLIGWSGLLVPALIRQVEHDFGQTDAGIGVFYLLFAIAWAVGSLGGGVLTERFGRRPVLALAAVLHGVGLLAQIVPSWGLFLVAALPRGVGSGAFDGGVNGLFLDLYPSTRGRALNAVHLFFSLGALSAPLAVGMLVQAGVPWQAVILATGLASFPLAVLFALAGLPPGRHAPDPLQAPSRFGLALPLLALAVAIGCYVASEVGVSSWLVRFLDEVPLTAATLALTLYWAGLAVGRLVSARIGDRFDHVRFAVVCSLAMAAAITLAVLVPLLPLSIALFGLAGVMSGPIYPMIIAIGGRRFPARAAAVSGFLTAAAVFGSVVYPPIMGFMSDAVGLTVAMLGAGILGVACAGALLLPVPRPPRRATEQARVSPSAGRS